MNVTEGMENEKERRSNPQKKRIPYECDLIPAGKEFDAVVNFSNIKAGLTETKDGAHKNSNLEGGTIKRSPHQVFLHYRAGKLAEVAVYHYLVSVGVVEGLAYPDFEIRDGNFDIDGDLGIIDVKSSGASGRLLLLARNKYMSGKFHLHEKSSVKYYIFASVEGLTVYIHGWLTTEEVKIVIDRQEKNGTYLKVGRDDHLLGGMSKDNYFIHTDDMHPIEELSDYHLSHTRSV